MFLIKNLKKVENWYNKINNKFFFNIFDFYLLFFNFFILYINFCLTIYYFLIKDLLIKYIFDYKLYIFGI